MSNILERQFVLCQTRAMRAHAEIISGAYKLKHTEKRYDECWMKMTDEELLQDKIAEMNQHIRLMQEISDNMDNENYRPTPVHTFGEK